MADSVVKLRVDSQEYDQKLKRAADGLTRYVDGCRKVGGTLEVVEQDTLKYVQALGKMETTSRTARGTLGEMTKAFTDLSYQYNHLTDAEKNSPFGKALNSSLEQLRTRVNNTKQELGDIGKKIGDTSTNFGGLKIQSADLKGVLGELGSRFGVNSELMSVVTSGTLGMTAAIGASATAVIAATKAWVDYNTELEKRDQDAAVITGLGEGEETQRISDAAKAMADTYGVDVREALNAVNTLMQQFGITSDEALQLVREGLQGMLQGDGPKLLSMIQQYAPSFRDAGIAADQLVAIIHNSEGGIFTDANMNAIVMGIKNIRLMTNATSEALKNVGIDADEVTRKLNDGSMTIFEALGLVSQKIQETGTGSQAAGEVMQQVFGRQGTAAGTNLGKAIETLNLNLEETKNQTGELGDAFADLETANENLNRAIRDCFGYDGIDEMKKKLETGLYNAIAKVLDAFTKVRDMLDEIGALDIGGKILDSILKAVPGLGKFYGMIKGIYDLVNSDGKDSGEGAAAAGAAIGQNIGKAIADTNKPSNTNTNNTNRNRNRNNNTNKGGGRTSSRGRSTSSHNTTSRPKTEQQQLQDNINNLKNEYVLPGTSAERRSEIEQTIARYKARLEEIQELYKQAEGTADATATDSVAGIQKHIQYLQQLQSQTATTAEEYAHYGELIDADDEKIRELQGIKPGSLQDLNRQLQDLQQKQSLAKTNEEWVKMGKEIDEVQKKINALTKPDFSQFNASNVSGFISDLQKQLQDADFGSTLYNNLTEKIKDAQNFQTILETAINNGINAADIGITPEVWKNMLTNGLTDDALQSYVDLLNERLKDKGIELKINAKGEVEQGDIESTFDKYKKGFEEIQQGWQGIEGVGNGIKGISDALEGNGTAWEKLTGVIDGVMQVISSALAIIELVNTLTKTNTTLSAVNTTAKTKEAAANTAVATSAAAATAGTTAQTAATVPAIAANKAEAASLTEVAAAAYMAAHAYIPFAGFGIGAGFAIAAKATVVAIGAASFSEGGMVDGNHFSGDQVPAMLNSGELVLNKAQQGNLASQLSDNGIQSLGLETIITGEDIRLVLNRNGRRTRRGELVTSTIHMQ